MKHLTGSFQRITVVKKFGWIWIADLSQSFLNVENTSNSDWGWILTFEKRKPISDTYGHRMIGISEKRFKPTLGHLWIKALSASHQEFIIREKIDTSLLSDAR